MEREIERDRERGRERDREREIERETGKEREMFNVYNVWGVGRDPKGSEFFYRWGWSLDRQYLSLRHTQLYV